MNIAKNKLTQHNCRLKQFPISFFSILLGLFGFSIVLLKLETFWQIQHIGSYSLMSLSLLIFMAITTTYILKIILFPKQVSEEFKHPIAMHFFPTISISFLLISIFFLHIQKVISHISWIIGVISQTIFFISIIGAWMNKEHFQIHHMNPSWFIPAVGTIIIPIAGIHLGYEYISWFFFSTGILFWIILLTIFFNRIMFHNPLPKKLIPTLFILIAPAAIGSIALLQLINTYSIGSLILVNIAIFFFIILLSQIKKFFAIEFYLSWWAYSFPLCALTINLFAMSTATVEKNWAYLATGLSIIVGIIILILIITTIKHIIKKNICIEE